MGKSRGTWTTKSHVWGTGARSGDTWYILEGEVVSRPAKEVGG